jgi:hypothetical protein
MVTVAPTRPHGRPTEWPGDPARPEHRFHDGEADAEAEPLGGAGGRGGGGRRRGGGARHGGQATAGQAGPCWYVCSGARLSAARHPHACLPGAQARATWASRALPSGTCTTSSKSWRAPLAVRAPSRAAVRGRTGGSHACGPCVAACSGVHAEGGPSVAGPMAPLRNLGHGWSRAYPPCATRSTPTPAPAHLRTASLTSVARFRSLAPMYYRGAQAAVVVYDCTSTVRRPAHVCPLPWPSALPGPSARTRTTRPRGGSRSSSGS